MMQKTCEYPEKAFKRLYDIYKDERSPYLKGIEEFFRWLNN